jgi:hypothetical protein
MTQNLLYVYSEVYLKTMIKLTIDEDSIFFLKKKVARADKWQ